VEGQSSLRLCVLGELTATRDGEVVDLGGRRQRAVLAGLVVMRDQPVPADRLADGVWGETPPANSTGAVQAYVSHLRRRLQPEAGARQRHGVIASTGAGYVLRLGPDSVDAWCFERAVADAAGLAPAPAAQALESALDLWRGTPYAEYAGESWVEAETVRLTELRGVARERLLAARLELGDAAVLVGQLESLVADDPLREEPWRLLVLALYRAHRQADALAALRRARTILAEELGVDPGPALRSLETEVLAQSPNLDAPPASEDTTPLAGRTTRAEVAPTDLVERTRETEALGRLVDDVAAGSSGFVVVEGPAGIGKSRLLVEASRLATASGVRVLSARGTELERSFGFGAVRQLFEPCLGDAGRREQLLTGAAAGASPVFEDAADGSAPAQGSFAILHGLYWVTVNLASEGALVLCVDDVQWCDSASVRYLAYLEKRLEGHQVLVVLARRTGEQQPDDALLDEISVDPVVTLLRPAPLSADAAATLVRERLGEGAESFVSACHRMTSGNPLLLRQLLRALEDEGIPPDVSHVDTVRAVGSRAVSALVALRLRRMPSAVTAAARAVALLGEAARLPTVAALAQLPEEEIAAALDILSRSELLTEEQDLAFVHPLIRQAVYDELPSAERALHHERAAQVLRDEGASTEQVAAHLLWAPRRGSTDTVELLRDAARTAMRRGATDATVLLLRRALEERAAETRPSVLVELGMVETLVDGPAGAAHLAEAYDLLDDELERARIGMVITRTHAFVSPPGVATEFAGRAAAAVPAELYDERQGLVALHRITGFMHGLPEGGYRSGPVPEVVGDGDGARMLAAVLGYELLRDGVDRERAVELCRFALDRDRLLEVDNGLLWVVAAIVLQLADEDLDDFWERAIVHARATGGLFVALSVNLWRGFTEWQHGQLDDALQSLADATEQQHMWGISGVSATYAAAFTLGVLLDRGDLEQASASLAAARALPWVGEGGRLMRDGAARLMIETSRPAEALDLLAAPTDYPEVVNPAWAPWRGLKARALAALGRGDEALDLADEELRLLRRWGAASSLGRSLRLRGVLRGEEGEPDLRESVAVLSGSRAVLEEARTQLVLGRSPWVPEVEAVTLLGSSLETAQRCGAESLAGAAARALGKRGASPVQIGDTPVRLTGRQRKVAELVAAGLDVNDVAHRLFLTPPTVRTVLESLPAGVAPTGSSTPQVDDGMLGGTEREDRHGS